VRYVFDLLQAEGFTLTITPDIAKEEVVEGIGFNPRGEESNIYTVEGTGTCLIGTAEITLGGYYAGRILDRDACPSRSPACPLLPPGGGRRRSVLQGLYRVHQFTKVEMFVFCLPDRSEAEHELLLELEERIFQGLEIPYRVVDTCVGDLGGRRTASSTWRPGCPAGGSRRVGRDHQHLQLHGLPGPPPRDPHQGGRQERVRAHAQRHGRGGVARPDRHSGELPAGRRLDPHPGASRALCGFRSIGPKAAVQA